MQKNLEDFRYIQTRKIQKFSDIFSHIQKYSDKKNSGIFRQIQNNSDIFRDIMTKQIQTNLEIFRESKINLDLFRYIQNKFRIIQIYLDKRNLDIFRYIQSYLEVFRQNKFRYENAEIQYTIYNSNGFNNNNKAIYNIQ